ncbi:IS3 family transposase [Chryseobacterium sp. MYb264]|uniref:IS3 family transposase n=1 Tax=Chryseobacterium sp. MYb264 TaxID=2745153 RepID=UPI002E0F0942|nr:IS3 family transposase [Chryseobacterium sp. MYb264]
MKEKIKQQITSIYFSAKQRYGSPRITFELNSLGCKISKVTVAKYMKELGLRSKLSKKFKVTTNSKHNYLVVENVLDRNFIAEKPRKFGFLTSLRGVQYASRKFANTLEFYGITRSMSRRGNCWDNAVAESFFKSLKTELIYGNKLISKEKMELEIFEYIEIWYNKKRRHSTLNYKTIEEFNNQNKIYQNVA